MTRSRRSGVAALAAGVLAALGCQPRNEYAPPPPPAVEVATPVERPVTDYLEFTGSTRAIATVELRARVNGYLEEIHFEDGSTVEEGQLLFTIEQAPYRTKLAMAEADLARARAALQLAEGELGRLRTLVRRDAGTVQELDIKQAERESAVAGLAAAEAAVEDAELQLAYCEIRAPIAGRIGRHLVDTGNLVQAEMTSLAIIERFDPIYVYFTLSEGDLLDLQSEQDPNQAAPSSPLGEGERVLEVGLGGEQGYPYTGRLDFADLGVDPGTGTLQLRGIFPNEDGRLLPGLFARVRTAVGAARPRLLVPDRALGTDQRGDYVLVVGDEDVVEYRSVTIGRSLDGMSVITSGLEGDERVVVNGVQFARPGAPVDPQPSDAAEGPEAVAEADAEAEAEADLGPTAPEAAPGLAAGPDAPDPEVEDAPAPGPTSGPREGPVPPAAAAAPSTTRPR
ncbi:efflux RND transporter periplasmic adaptor subunit [Tautonia plasticadhaerens]|uniref:Efflux pump periplasmic linker BepF n=1 Tax=Tautonia plasticadhaerens TaxID=2527974 RepID=A0A518GUF0_9BACT|nr:efflux RND transporter periplasmic adaptor subunit [Tautonia plasticadhaerens]QDV32222.1 Efflux pump periplasmic linker BepF [Tautonia plasticadhaerens]